MSKRQVSYNQEAVLCSVCTKRIRLNNSGRLRVHLSGKMGSAYCSGSDTEPVQLVTKNGRVLTDADIQALADEAEAGYELSPPSTAEELAQTLFSDL